MNINKKDKKKLNLFAIDLFGMEFKGFKDPL